MAVVYFVSVVPEIVILIKNVFSSKNHKSLSKLAIKTVNIFEKVSITISLVFVSIGFDIGLYISLVAMCLCSFIKRKISN